MYNRIVRTKQNPKLKLQWKMERTIKWYNKKKEFIILKKITNLKKNIGSASE